MVELDSFNNDISMDQMTPSSTMVAIGRLFWDEINIL